MNVRDLPPHDPTRLITLANDARVPTDRGETDATTALTRGIAEYVSMLALPGPGGGSQAFAKCFDAYAQPEDEADYPAFVAYTNDNDGSYDAANFSPRINSAIRFPNGSYEASSAEMTVDVKCEIWANSPEERYPLVKLLEEAFEPVEWMYGFRLELPHYFNQRATFLPSRVTYLGGPAEAMSGFVNARFVVRASVPKTRALSFPILVPQIRYNVGTSPVPPTDIDDVEKP